MQPYETYRVWNQNPKFSLHSPEVFISNLQILMALGPRVWKNIYRLFVTFTGIIEAIRSKAHVDQNQMRPITGVWTLRQRTSTISWLRWKLWTARFSTTSLAQECRWTTFGRTMCGKAFSDETTWFETWQHLHLPHCICLYGSFQILAICCSACSSRKDSMHFWIRLFKSAKVKWGCRWFEQNSAAGGQSCISPGPLGWMFVWFQIKHIKQRAPANDVETVWPLEDLWSMWLAIPRGRQMLWPFAQAMHSTRRFWQPLPSLAVFSPTALDTRRVQVQIGVASCLYRKDVESIAPTNHNKI